MPVLYKPKSRIKALSLIASFPNYSFTDANNRKKIRIEDSEIISIFNFKEEIYIQFKKDNYSSFIKIKSESCQLILPKPIEIVKSEQFINKKKNTIKIYLPNAMALALVIIIIILAELNLFIFASAPARVWQEKSFVNSTCDAKCVHAIFSSFGTLSILLSTTILPLIFGIMFYFWRKPKIRDWNIFIAFQTESSLMFFVLATLGLNVSAKLLEKPKLQKLALMYEKLRPSSYEISSKVKK